jgi:hypothetical protein
MARTTCLVCLISTVSGCHKNTLVRASVSSEQITKLEQSTFLRYLWLNETGAIFTALHNLQMHPIVEYFSVASHSSLVLCNPIAYWALS